MAFHVRRQIRDAIVAALSGLPLTGARVFANRAARIDPSATPCLVITTPAEAVSPLRPLGPQLYDRDITVVVDGYVSGSGLDDAADAVGVEVEQAMNVAGALGGLLQQPLALQETRLEIDDTASPPVAALRMVYRAATATLAADPTAPA